MGGWMVGWAVGLNRWEGEGQWRVGASVARRRLIERIWRSRKPFWNASGSQPGCQPCPAPGRFDAAELHPPRAAAHANAALALPA